MNSRPILFSAPMVKAILAGNKTQTRRIVKPQPSDGFLPTIGDYQRSLVRKSTGELYPEKRVRFGASDENEDYPCPYGRPGDQLWVKETFCFVAEGGTLTPAYRADAWTECPAENGKWKPSIFCTRAASRIALEITSVRMERLQDISEADAVAEGTAAPAVIWEYFDNFQFRAGYKTLWESINGPGSWDANPSVWVITFTKK